MITPPPRDMRPSLGQREFLFVVLMLLACFLIEAGGRLLSIWQMTGRTTTEALGLLTYLPLALAMLVLHRHVRYAINARALFTGAILLLLVSQVADFAGALDLTSIAPGWARPLRMFEGILFSAGSITLLGASYMALMEAETGHELLLRKRELLESEIEERELAEETSRRARAELALRVRERTAELAERNKELAQQLAEGERVRAELVRSHNLLRQTEEITKSGAWELDFANGLVSGTAEFWRIFEYDGTGPVQVDTLLKSFDEDALATVQGILQRAQEQATPWEIELPFLGMKGTQRWIRTIGFPVRGRDGAVVRVSGTMQDVTDRKSTEMELRESESMLHAVIRSAPIFLWALDRDGCITLNTGLGLTRLGYPMGRNVGKNLFEIYSEDTQIAMLARRAISGEACSEVLENDGLQLHATYSPLYDAHGQLAGAIGVAIDITRERAFEERIRVNQKMEAIGALAGGIAHDFNNILYAMDGFAALAAKEAAAVPTAVHCIDELRAAGARAMELVDRILSFSRQEAPCRELLDLREEARNCARLLENSLGPELHLALELDADTPEIIGDPAQIQQVLLNLTSNARHAMRETGGELRIAVRPCMVEAGQEDDFGDLAPGLYVELTVADTGIGIDPQVASRLYEPFFTTKPVGEGTGLGLAIVHSVVTAHHGRIQLIPAQPKGTIARILLPTGTVVPNPLGLVEAAPEELPTVTPRRVLVVDDEPQIRIFLRLLLEDAGHLALCHRNGEEALAALRAPGTVEPDIALIDLVMPGMGGVKFVRALREIYPSIPIIICSGHAAAESSPEVRALKVAAFVKKPVDTRALLALIASINLPIQESLST
jgi:PAS domain S-box-containing protein